MNVPAVTPEVPSRFWRALLAALGRLPAAGLSRGLGRVADLPLPVRLRRPVLGAFAAALGIDRDEAEHPLEAYGSLNEFFVRRLREGVRQWPPDPRAVGSPVDGVVGRLGPVEGGRLIQAKGRDYSAAELLADAEEAGRYEGGSFLTVYLSPRHYHRIHAPIGGSIREARHVPGALFPVNEQAVSHVDRLFARNERLVCHIASDGGRTALVAVGAYNVARISTAFDPAWSGGGTRPWVTNRKEEGRPPRRVYDPPLPIRRGEEVMAFHLGSTVVLLLEPGGVRLGDGLRPGMEIRLGETVAEPV